MQRWRRGGGAWLAVALGLLVTACERGAPSGTSQPAGSPTTQTAHDQAANVRDMLRASDKPGGTALPEGHPPIGGGTGAAPPGEAALPAAQPGGLKYTAPDTWQRVPVRGGIRSDQYRLPRAPGDSEDGDLAVFTNIGGTVDDNIARWRTQFSTLDGQAIPDEAFVRQTFEVSGLKITLVDVAGRYRPGAMMPGTSAPAPKDNCRLLGAVVETPGGLWFFKALGPSATMAAHRDEFVQFLHSLRAE